MADVELRDAGDGRFEIHGDIVFASVEGLLRSSHTRFPETGSLVVDLANVTRVDSAALALLFEWIRLAREGDVSIRFVGMPERLQSIAQLTGVDPLLKEYQD